MPVLKPIRVISFNITKNTHLDEKIINKEQNKTATHCMVNSSDPAGSYNRGLVKKKVKELARKDAVFLEPKKPSAMTEKLETIEQLNYLNKKFPKQNIELIIYSDDEQSKRLHKRFNKNKSFVPANITVVFSSDQETYDPIKGEGVAKQAHVKTKTVLSTRSTNTKRNTWSTASGNENTPPHSSTNSTPSEDNKSNNAVISKEGNVGSNKQWTSTALMQNRLVNSSAQNIQKSAGSVPQPKSSPSRSDDDDDLFRVKPDDLDSSVTASSALWTLTTSLASYHKEPTWLQKNGSGLATIASVTIGSVLVSAAAFFLIAEVFSAGLIAAGIVAALYFIPTLATDVAVGVDMASGAGERDDESINVLRF